MARPGRRGAGTPHARHAALLTTGSAEPIPRTAVDDLRAAGWAVAVHNDYRLNGEPHTFWLFTKGDHCAKGEGRTDAEALAIVAREVARIDPGLAWDARRRS